MRARFIRPVLLASWLGMLVSPSGAQDTWVETEFHRVYLKNGNVIDGHLTKQSPVSVTLALKAGEMIIKVDTIDKIEFLKMRSLAEAPKREVLRPRIPESRIPPSVPPEMVPNVNVPGAPPNGRASRLRTPEELYRPDPEIRRRADEILAGVERADLESRDQVALRLREVGGDVAPYLASLLEKTSRDLGLQILQVLFKMKDPKAVPVLMALLESQNSTVRGQVASLLAETQGPGSLRALGPLAKDEDPTVRQIVATWIQRVGDRNSIEMLGPLLDDPDRDVRGRAQMALLDLGQRFDRNDRVASILEETLRSSAPRVKPELLLLIGKSGLREAWRAAAPFVSNDDPMIRKAAISTLATLAVPESGDTILSQIPKEKDDSVRIPLAEAVPRLKILPAIPYLIDWLEGPSPEVRTAALKALQSAAGTTFGADRKLWDEWWQKNSPK
jgi:HEAT repeat protein